MEIANKFKPFRLSPLTREIEKELLSLPTGDIIYYEQLTNLIGLDCCPSGDGYRYFCTARDRLVKQGIRFINIPKNGYKKLSDNESVLDIGYSQKRLYKKNNKELISLESIEYKNLDLNEQFQYNAIKISGTFVKRILSEKVKNKMIERIKKEPEKIDYENLIEVYLRKK